MNTTKHTTVRRTDGRRTILSTDDTFTLAFTGMVESTPATLSERISPRSLRHIVETSNDANEISKALRALEIDRNSVKRKTQ